MLERFAISTKKTKKYKILPVTAKTVPKNRNKYHYKIHPEIEMNVRDILNMDFWSIPYMVKERHLT